MSSSKIRTGESRLRLGLVGEMAFIEKYKKECDFVNGVTVTAAYTSNPKLAQRYIKNGIKVVEQYQTFLEAVDAVYIASLPEEL